VPRESASLAVWAAITGVLITAVQGYVVYPITPAMLASLLCSAYIILSTEVLLNINRRWGHTIGIASTAAILWAVAALSDYNLLYSITGLVGAGAIAEQRMRQRQAWRSKVAAQLEASLEDAHQYELLTARAQSRSPALQKRQARYQALQEVAERLSGSWVPERVVRCLAGESLALIGKSQVSLVYTVDTDRQMLALSASERTGQVGPIQEKQGDTFDYWVLRHRRPLLVEDLSRDFRFPAATTSRPMHSVIAAPLMINNLRILETNAALLTVQKRDDR